MDTTTISLVVIAVLGLGLFYIKNQGSSGNSNVKNINTEELKEAIKANPEIQLVDVRTKAETKGGMIKPAIHIDYFSSGFADKIAVLDKEKPVYLYCRSGNRSGKAGKVLDGLGFSNIYNLKGGYMAWSR